MLRTGLVVYFLSCCFISQAQFPQPALSKWANPEYLWQLKDSLSKVDTLSLDCNKLKYYELSYSCDYWLFQFDKKPQHLINGLKWISGQMAHGSLTEKLCQQGLYCATHLNDETIALYYSTLLENHFPPEQRNEATKRQINTTRMHFHWGEYVNEPYLMDIHFGCDLDTTVSILPNKRLQFDAQDRSYNLPELVEGDSTYAVFEIHTVNCKTCRDCSYAHTIYLRLVSEKLPQAMDFTAYNSAFTTTNVWIYNPVNEVVYGKFYRNEYGAYLSIVTKYPSETEWYDLNFYWFSPEKLVGL